MGEIYMQVCFISSILSRSISYQILWLGTLVRSFTLQAETTFPSSTNGKNWGWTRFFSAPLYLDVVDLHPTAVCCCQSGGELDLLGQLPPFPALRFGALNLQGMNQHCCWRQNPTPKRFIRGNALLLTQNGSCWSAMKAFRLGSLFPLLVHTFLQEAKVS